VVVYAEAVVLENYDNERRYTGSPIPVFEFAYDRPDYEVDMGEVALNNTDGATEIMLGGGSFKASNFGGQKEKAYFIIAKPLPDGVPRFEMEYDEQIVVLKSISTDEMEDVWMELWEDGLLEESNGVVSLKEGRNDLGARVAQKFGVDSDVAEYYVEAAESANDVKDFADTVYMDDEDEDGEFYCMVAVPYADLKELYRFIKGIDESAEREFASILREGSPKKYGVTGDGLIVSADDSPIWK
jgi:hypothetical protein